MCKNGDIKHFANLIQKLKEIEKKTNLRVGFDQRLALENPSRYIRNSTFELKKYCVKMVLPHLRASKSDLT